MDDFRAWVSKHRGQILFVVALLVIFGTGGSLLYLLTQPLYGHLASEKVIPAKPKPKYYSPLTGLEVVDEATTKRPVTAIMIENSPDARPQSGLKDAGIIYEAVAEGGITRFLALYQEGQPGLIGPVRSVRPYYVEWADPYDASLAHIGGSANALSMIRSGKYSHDLDQFFNAPYFWRASDRYAPHNVYTSFEKLNALEAKKGIITSTFTGFKRKPDAAAKTPTATNITVNISGPLYNSHYIYDATTNSYARSEGGAAHTDREKGQLAPKIVVVLAVTMTLAFEDGYREQIQTTGTGKAYVFQDGLVTEGSWSRDTTKSPLQLLDGAGKLIDLNAGQTWITALPKERVVSWQ